MFVDARELGESRVRTNHSVAGIHYYRREYVPKSTPSLSLSLSTSLRFTSERSGTFFFFFSKLHRLGHILWSLHSERKVMKKPRGCSHTQAKVCFPVQHLLRQNVRLKS